MAIDRGSPEPLYQQLAAIIRSQIASGELPRRTRIPSMRDMAAEYDLAEMTVRHAVRILVAEGLLVTADGKGTFVR